MLRCAGRDFRLTDVRADELRRSWRDAPRYGRSPEILCQRTSALSFFASSSVNSRPPIARTHSSSSSIVASGRTAGTEPPRRAASVSEVSLPDGFMFDSELLNGHLVGHSVAQVTMPHL